MIPHLRSEIFLFSQNIKLEIEMGFCPNSDRDWSNRKRFRRDVLNSEFQRRINQQSGFRIGLRRSDTKFEPTVTLNPPKKQV